MEYIKDLSKKDKIMAELIKKFGFISLEKIESTEYFKELVDIIIGQQLSVKAATTIRNRFLDSVGSIEPKKIASLEIEEMRILGISNAKAKYIKELAVAIENKILNLSEIEFMDDENGINELIKIKGIGKWSAEMFLLFCLGRENIYSYGDAGLKNAFNKLYGAELSVLEMMEIVNNWSPYKSYASLYLWKFLDNKPILNED